MNTSHPASAKILQHSEGMGAPCAADLRRRATELAFLDGRLEHNNGDWMQAKRELHGGHNGTASDDEAEMVSLVSQHDGVVTDLGHHVANMLPEDAGNVVEELIFEGMDEALHEQMLAARCEEPVEGEDDEED